MSNAPPVTLVPLGAGVAEFLNRERISSAALDRMLQTAARITHEWGNRRFFDYVFLLEDGELVRIGNMAKKTVSSGGDNDFIVYEPCESCGGGGCHVCGFSGDIPVTRQITKGSTTFGVMR